MKTLRLYFSLCAVCMIPHQVHSSDVFESIDEHKTTLEREEVKRRRLDSTLYTPSEIRHYLLSLDFERKEHHQKGVSISPLKLQKLLYYAQAYHLSIFGSPLFIEDFKKWDHGPVVVSEYTEFAHKRRINRTTPISKNHCDEQALTQDVQKIENNLELIYFLKSLYESFLFKTAEELSAQTHRERPWCEASENFPIPQEIIADFFRGPPIFNFIKNSIGQYEHAMHYIHSAREHLLSSSAKRLDDFQNSLDDLLSKIPDVLLQETNHPFLIKFEGQTEPQAFLGNFFFPDFLINGFEPSSIYFQHRTLTRLLSFSAHYNNPIAFFYLFKFFNEVEIESAATHFLTLSKDLFTRTLQTQVAFPSHLQSTDVKGLCYFYLSDINKEEGDFEKSSQNMTQALSLLSRSTHSTFLLQASKRELHNQEHKKQMLQGAADKGEGEARYLLAMLETNMENKKQMLKRAIEEGSLQSLYTLGGLLLLENSTSHEGISYLKEAIKKGSYAAATYLAKKVPSKAEEAYTLASEFGFQVANYRKYEILISQGRVEEAKESLLQADILLRDAELLEILSEEDKERVSDDLATYIETLSKVAGFHIDIDETMNATNDSLEEF